jgi:hypothetical protein
MKGDPRARPGRLGFFSRMRTWNGVSSIIGIAVLMTRPEGSPSFPPVHAALLELLATPGGAGVIGLWTPPTAGYNAVMARKKKMLFGKHKGKFVENLPVGYLLWLYNNVDLDRWGIRCAVEAALGMDEEDTEDDEPTVGVIEERLEQVIREKQQVERRLLESQGELHKLRDRFRLGYRRLSFVCHPDRGGSHDLMVLVNDLLKPDAS